ncbi:nitroreductase family protein [Aliihoeflea aestuarii]|uniref:nitroreductase family protein n=1 Tax=Aliihoeflea aestuarii TaxID=453840 RepID=UPI0027E227FC|nr:nitroreductase family protein [Aliihoeflea aestuarii]
MELQFSSAEEILQRLADRRSCRDFAPRSVEKSVLLSILRDGLEAPSSCNQQHWHFVLVTDDRQKARAAELAGGNPHFQDCAALIYLCFQKGWTHDNFSVVQGVAAAAYHMMLSAHLRGLGAIWNAGIGDRSGVRDMLQLPEIFELQGALAIGHARSEDIGRKPPRRPLESVVSFDTFERPEETIYPAVPSKTYRFDAMSKADNPYAVWDPQRWSWAQLADYRAWSVWAKSPLPGVYTSRRQGQGTQKELDLIPDLRPGAKVAELMPWGGTSTVALANRLPADVSLSVVELHRNHFDFIADRCRREGVGRPIDYALMVEGRLPFDDHSIDLLVVPQTLEHMADPQAVLADAARVLKPSGRLVVSARNLTSRYGAEWARVEAKGQVPLQGPFTPLRPRRLLDLVNARFEIEALHGIGRTGSGDADVLTEGSMRFRRRVIALRARPR